MKELIFALISGIVGVTLLFAGYRLARILIPLWGLLAGFALGAAGVSDAMNNSFLGTTLGIVVGICVGLLFALLSYFFFSLAVVLFSASLGYWLGTSLVLFLGFNKGFLSAAVGIALGAVVGVVALFGNFPKYYLIIASSIAGSVAIAGAFMLLTNKIELDAYSYAQASKAVTSSWLWSLIVLVMSVIGIGVQIKTDTQYELEQWGMLSQEPKKVDSTVE